MGLKKLINKTLFEEEDMVIPGDRFVIIGDFFDIFSGKEKTDITIYYEFEPRMMVALGISLADKYELPWTFIAGP